MHMMFVDESGDPGYPKDGNWTLWKGSKCFARVGVIIHGWRWRAWDQRLRDFKRSRGLTWDSEIKASHIRRGQGVFIGWVESRRTQFFHDLLTIIGGNEDFTLIGVNIDKQSVDISKGDRMVKPQVRSLELLLERYNSYLHHQKDQCGIVVLDPVDQMSDDNLRHFQGYLQNRSSHFNPLRIVEGTFFAKSHTSSLIQISDICTNVFYRHMLNMPGSKEEFNLISSRFWRRNAKLQGYGIKKWPEVKNLAKV